MPSLPVLPLRERTQPTDDSKRRRWQSAGDGVFVELLDSWAAESWFFSPFPPLHPLSAAFDFPVHRIQHRWRLLDFDLGDFQLFGDGFKVIKLVSP